MMVYLGLLAWFDFRHLYIHPVWLVLGLPILVAFGGQTDGWAAILFGLIGFLCWLVLDSGWADIPVLAGLAFYLGYQEMSLVLWFSVLLGLLWTWRTRRAVPLVSLLWLSSVAKLLLNVWMG